MSVESFYPEVGPSELEDLLARLSRTRYARGTAVADGHGVTPEWLRQAVAEWTALDPILPDIPEAGDHVLVSIDGTRTHAVITRGPTQAAARVTVLLLHGWPSSYSEYVPLAELLVAASTDELAFDVVIPSYPGFAFSDAPAGPVNAQTTALTMHRLLVDQLKVDRYIAVGGDIASGVVGRLATGWPEEVAGAVFVGPPWPGGFEDPTEAERAWMARNEEHETDDNGYSAIMSTRPDTIAAALVDSPAGLLAWIADKHRDWSDCGGEIERRFPHDYLLHLASLYWATGCIRSSFRSYTDSGPTEPRPRIAVPSAVALTREAGMEGVPRAFVERSLDDIRIWDEGPGGHFLGYEEPDRLARIVLALARDVTHPGR